LGDQGLIRERPCERRCTKQTRYTVHKVGMTAALIALSLHDPHCEEVQFETNVTATNLQ